jgi:hypothetical protein
MTPARSAQEHRIQCSSGIEETHDAWHRPRREAMNLVRRLHVRHAQFEEGGTNRQA